MAGPAIGYVRGKSSKDNKINYAIGIVFIGFRDSII
jgi:hypothetical protein